jgi:hypothetical protein
MSRKLTHLSTQSLTDSIRDLLLVYHSWTLLLRASPKNPSDNTVSEELSSEASDSNGSDPQASR